MFEQCDSCASPSKSCIPRVMSMSPQDQREWCKMWKLRLGWSKKTLAEKSGVPEGTLAGILGTKVTREARPYTMRAIIGALIGCPIEEVGVCIIESEQVSANDHALEYERLSNACAQYIEEVKRLEQVCAEQAGKIRELEETVKELEDEKKFTTEKLRAAEKVEKSQETMSDRLMKIAVMALSSVLVLLVIAGLFVLL